MSTDWRKLGLFLVGVGGLYVILVGIAADFAQILSLKQGTRLLVLLFLAALGYKVRESVHRHWTHYRTLQRKLHEVHDFILGSMGKQSTNIFACANAHWLRQYGQTISVSGLQSDSIVVLDLSHIPLKPEDSLYGMWFSIIDQNGKNIGQGQVKLFTTDQACIELYEPADVPRVGDLAIPIEPPEASDPERLLGKILYFVTQ